VYLCGRFFDAVLPQPLLITRLCRIKALCGSAVEQRQSENIIMKIFVAALPQNKDRVT
jgi:hypothetical protein